MIVPIDISEKKPKCSDYKKCTWTKRVRLSIQDTSVHDLEIFIQDIDDYTSKNVAETYEINLS